MVKWQDLQDIVDSRNRQSSNTGSTIAALAAGAALGVVAGLMLAPKSGRETRDDLLQKAQRGMDKGKDKVEDAADAVKDKADQAADAANRAADRGKDAVEETRGRNGTRGRS